MTDTKQPEALRLADAIDPPQIACLPETRAFAAIELRRLHEVNQELLEALEIILDSRPFVGMNPKATVGSPYAVEWNVHTIAREAIAKAEVTK
jgi:hypothetical protein